MNFLDRFPVTGGKGHKPIYYRWWFWVGIVFLLALTWYLSGYLNWKGEQAGKNTENILAYTYWKLTQQQQAALEDSYKKDTYGGSTPEETLKLFVQALEKKDYQLASKYFVVENQKENLDGFPKAEASGGMSGFINAYRKGRVVSPDAVGSSGIYEYELYEPGQDVPFGIRLVKNKFTNKWKILEL